MFFSFFSTSIIGHIYTLTTFTQGTWDASLRKITITRAFPGKSMVQHNHDHQNALQEAEMDPVCEVVLKSQVESCGLQVVGWYVAPILPLSSLNFQIDCTGCTGCTGCTTNFTCVIFFFIFFVCFKCMCRYHSHPTF